MAEIVGGTKHLVYWVPSRELQLIVASGVAVNAIGAPIQYVVQEQAQETAQKRAQKEALAESRLREALAQYNDEYVRTVIGCAIEVERSLKNGLPRRNGKRGRKPYQLGLASYGVQAEKNILCLLGFVDRVGFSIAAHDLSPEDVSRLHRTAWSKWIPLLEPLLDTQQLTLDEARREQVARVITTLKLICDEDAEVRSARQSWSRITLTHARLRQDPMGGAYLNVVLRNPNLISAPVGALRIAARTHDGLLTGYWVVVPSDAGIPQLGEIEVGVHLEPKSNGIPGEVEAVGDLKWLGGALAKTEHLPAPAGQTHRLPNGDAW